MKQTNDLYSSIYLSQAADTNNREFRSKYLRTLHRVPLRSNLSTLRIWLVHGRHVDRLCLVSQKLSIKISIKYIRNARSFNFTRTVSSFRIIRFIAIEIEIEAPLARRIVRVYSSRGQSIREVFLRRFSRSLGGARSKTPFSASLASSFSSRSSLDNFANFDRTDSFFFFLSPSRSCALLSSRAEDFSHYENEYSPKETTCYFHVCIEKLIIRLWIKKKRR